MREEFAIPLVGRTGELSFLEATLPGRILTAMGPPGVGKTRLVREFARDRDHVFVELVGISSRSEVLHSVANAIGSVSTAQNDEELAASIGRHFQQRPSTLLILDNTEDIVDPLAFLVDWSRAHPGMSVLATSRRPMDIEGEALLKVEPLSSDDAVEMFRQAVQLATGFRRKGDSELEATKRVVEKLDCLPLLLEMAAARMRVMTVTQLEARLESRLRLLAMNDPALPDRNSSLRATLDWSWERLSDTARSALIGCTLFAGRFPLEGAEAIIAAIPGLAREPVDVFQELVDNSLVASSRTEDGLAFRLFQGIKEYASEHAAALDSWPHLESAFSEYFFQHGLRLASDAQDLSTCLSACKAMVRELPNFGRAIRALSAEGQPESRRLALAVATTIDGYAPRKQILDVITAGLWTPIESHDETGTTIALFAMRAGMWQNFGDSTRAKEDSETAYRLVEESARSNTPESGAAISNALRVRALLLWCRNERDEVPALLERAVEAAGDDEDARGRALVNLFGMREVYGTETKLLRGGEPHATLKEMRSPKHRIYALYYLAIVTADPVERLRRSKEAFALAEAIDDKIGMARTLTSTGWSHHENRQWEAAQSALQRAAECSLGMSRFVEAMARLHLAGVAAVRGEWENTETLLRRCEELWATKGEDVYPMCLLWPFQAARAAHLEQREDADAWLNRAENAGAKALAHVMRGCVDLLDSRRAMAAGDIAVSESALRRAEARLASPEREEMVSLAKRVLEQELLRLPEWVDPWHAPESTIVGPGGTWFRLPGAARTRLDSRPNLCLVLEALSVARARTPERVLSTDELVEAGWPGESMRESAGHQRLRTAIRTLRKMGLEGILLSAKPGYRLDPSIPFLKAESRFEDEA